MAGLCETAFTFCMGKMKETTGNAHLMWLAGFVAFSVLSMALLARATQNLPIGTAYPVWTGIGAVGTVLAGIFFFGEPATILRLVFIFTLVCSVVGLKMVE